MRVLLSIVVILSVLSTTLATENEIENKEEIKEETLDDLTLAKDNSIEELTDVNQNEEVTRKKKSTTTFCVEIRPSGPYQKPFQVCEPSEPAKPAESAQALAYSAPTPAYYPSANYVAQEQPKTQVSYQPTPSPSYKLASQSKPVPSYSAVGKAFSPSSSKTFSSNVPLPYSTYRSKSEEIGGEEHVHDHMHMMRMTHASSEEDDEMKSDPSQMRSGYGGYKYSYGGPSSYIPIHHKTSKSKHHGHNGLVITCQPNLAGYAHNVPSSFHHPPSIPSYSYRSTPRGYDRHLRFQHQQSYGGGYQQAPSVDKQQPGALPLQSPAPKQHHMFRPSAYDPAGNQAYNPAIHRSSSPVYNPALLHSQPPPSEPYGQALLHYPKLSVSQKSSSHQVAESSASSDYGAHSQSQAASIPTGFEPPAGPPPQLPPGSTYAQPVPSGYAHPASPLSEASYAPVPQIQEHSAPSFAAAPASIPAGPLRSAYASAPSYAPPAVSGSNIAPQAQSYIPPGTYRESEDETLKKIESGPKDDKELHTLKKMEEISHQRAVESKWESEVSTDRTQAMKTEEHVGQPHQEWMRSTENDKNLDAESVAINHIETNEIENSSS